jgi:hypothetical protein
VDIEIAIKITASILISRMLFALIPISMNIEMKNVGIIENVIVIASPNRTIKNKKAAQFGRLLNIYQ